MNTLMLSPDLAPPPADAQMPAPAHVVTPDAVAGTAGVYGGANREGANQEGNSHVAESLSRVQAEVGRIATGAAVGRVSADVVHLHRQMMEQARRMHEDQEEDEDGDNTPGVEPMEAPKPKL